MQLVAIAVASLTAAFCPLLYSAGKEHCIAQLLQIFRRLFPFGRGLVHAYWAPNIWALYCLCDKILGFVSVKYFDQGSTLEQRGYNSTAGLVGDFHFNVLPRVSAAVCLLLTMVSIFPGLTVLWYRSDGNKMIGVHRRARTILLVRILVNASLSSFMLGYHVHEKAILTPMILQLFLSVLSPEDGFFAILLAQVGGYSLFPLFTGLPELPLKGLKLIGCIFIFFSF